MTFCICLDTNRIVAIVWRAPFPKASEISLRIIRFWNEEAHFTQIIIYNRARRYLIDLFQIAIVVLYVWVVQGSTHQPIEWPHPNQHRKSWKFEYPVSPLDSMEVVMFTTLSSKSMEGNYYPSTIGLYPKTIRGIASSSVSMSWCGRVRKGVLMRCYPSP